MNGQIDVAKLLMAKGADFNAKDRWGHTPRHYAVMIIMDVLRFLRQQDRGGTLSAMNNR